MQQDIEQFEAPIASVPKQKMATHTNLGLTAPLSVSGKHLHAVVLLNAQNVACADQSEWCCSNNDHTVGE